MSITYFKWRGFSINEGGRYANIHMSWPKKGYRFYIYIFIWKWRFYKIMGGE